MKATAGEKWTIGSLEQEQKQEFSEVVLGVMQSVIIFFKLMSKRHV